MGESTPAGAGFADGSPLAAMRTRLGRRRAIWPRCDAAFWLMVLIVVPLTATVLALSLLLPKTYTATASLVLDEQTGRPGRRERETSVRRLATTQRLLTLARRPRTRRRAAPRRDRGHARGQGEGDVRSTAADIIARQGVRRRRGRRRRDRQRRGAARSSTGERAADARSDAAARRELEEAAAPARGERRAPRRRSVPCGTGSPSSASASSAAATSCASPRPRGRRSPPRVAAPGAEHDLRPLRLALHRRPRGARRAT